MSFDFKMVSEYEKKVIDATQDALHRARTLYYSVPTAVTFNPFTWDRQKEKPTALWGIPVVIKMGQDPRTGQLHWDHFALTTDPSRYEFEIGLPELRMRPPSPSTYPRLSPTLAFFPTEHHKMVDVRRLRSVHDALDFAAREIGELGK